MNFFEAWHWLSDHPINISEGYKTENIPEGLNVGLYGLDIHVARVNPETGSIDDDDSLNTQTEVWLEHGPFEDYGKEFLNDPTVAAIPLSYRYQRTHDIRLDCGGKTFEEAIIKLAALVKEHYGDYSVS